MGTSRIGLPLRSRSTAPSPGQDGRPPVTSGQGHIPFTVVSLFAGCGGLDIGFKEMGFDLVYACDSDSAAVACYRHNVDERVVRQDVNDPSFLSELRAIGSCDVVLGGFPCQGFSKAGPKRCDDERNSLYLRMREAVGLLRPQVFLAENVDGIEQNFQGVFVDRIRDGFRFDTMHYDVDYRILDAQCFGVPQHRRRAFFVGLRQPQTAEFDWPSPTHEQRTRNGEFRVSTGLSELPLWKATRKEKALPPPRTVRDAIGDLIGLPSEIPDHAVTNAWPDKYSFVFKAIGAGQKLCNVRHSPTSVYTWQIPEVFGEVSQNELLVLETISRNRRHKEYGDIPNGNPLPLAEIERLSGLAEAKSEVESLLGKGYLKVVNDGYDLKGAMFCSGLFKRPSWDEPSPTVLTNFHNPRYFLHPCEDRPFSLRECARLQSFSDSFVFGNAGISLVEGYRLVGNAVPPLLGRALAKAFLAFLVKGISPQVERSCSGESEVSK